MNPDASWYGTSDSSDPPGIVSGGVGLSLSRYAPSLLTLPQTFTCSSDDNLLSLPLTLSLIRLRIRTTTAEYPSSAADTDIAAVATNQLFRPPPRPPLPLPPPPPNSPPPRPPGSLFPPSPPFPPPPEPSAPSNPPSERFYSETSTFVVNVPANVATVSGARNVNGQTCSAKLENAAIFITTYDKAGLIAYYAQQNAASKSSAPNSGLVMYFGTHWFPDGEALFAAVGKGRPSTITPANILPNSAQEGRLLPDGRKIAAAASAPQADAWIISFSGDCTDADATAAHAAVGSLPIRDAYLGLSECLQAPPPSKKDDGPDVALIAGCTGGAVGALLLVGGVWWWYLRRKAPHHRSRRHVSRDEYNARLLSL